MEKGRQRIFPHCLGSEKVSLKSWTFTFAPWQEPAGEGPHAAGKKWVCPWRSCLYIRELDTLPTLSCKLIQLKGKKVLWYSSWKYPWMIYRNLEWEPPENFLFHQFPFLGFSPTRSELAWITLPYELPTTNTSCEKNL